jgi:hypothetical protein
MTNKVQVIFEIDKDAQGRTTLRQLESGVTRLGRSGKQAGADIDAGISSFVQKAAVVEFFRRGASEAIAFGQAAVTAFNEANNAALGLQSVARFKGFDPADTVEQVKNLELVKSGLLTIGEASTALKNLLQAGFGLDQSIELIKRFGDSAAFGKQAALSFGQAVVSTSEGIRNQNSILSDNGGITKNLSVILKERGFQLQDLSDKVKGAAAREALYNGLLAETQAQIGDAAKLTTTFAGEQAKLEAQQKILLATTGELITKSPELRQGMQALADVLAEVTKQVGTSGTNLNTFVKDAAASLGGLFSVIKAGLPLLQAMVALFNIMQELNPLKIFAELRTAKLIDVSETKKESDKAKLIFDDIEKRLEKFSAKPIVDPTAVSQGQKTTTEITKSSDAYFKRIEEANKRFAAGIREIGAATADLQAKLSIDPVANLFEAQEASRKSFIEKLRDVPREFKEAFEKASRDAQALDLFKGVLGQGQALARTRFQIAELEAGGDPRKLAQARRDAIQQEIDQAKRFLDIAANPAQRQLAIGRIVEATNNISELTPEQRDIRFKALNEQATVQEQLFRENFSRLTAQTNAQKDNTVALVQVGNRLAAVEGALTNFKEGAIIKIVDESNGAATVNLGSV